MTKKKVKKDENLPFIPLEAEHPTVSVAGMNASFPTANAGFNTQRELLTGFIPQSEPLLKLLERLNAGETGLTEQDAAARLKEFGANELPEPKAKSKFSVFVSQFSSPLIFILLIAAAIVILMGEIADGVIIFLVLFFNAAVGTIQEGKAQNTLLALRKFAEGSATVLRDGREIIIPDKETVPGDIIVLREGEKIPADARLTYVSSLRTDESALTGESTPVAKISDDMAGESLSAQERRNMVFKGTNVAGGNGRALVVGTGLNTEIGRISREISSIETDLPLKKNISYLSKAILASVSAISVFIFILGLVKGQDLRQMFATVVSLSVSIIPEGLPIVMTLVLASGVWRMSKQNVLVKRLQAVEGLGQAKIIAVDKTGTLTKNEMTVEKVYVNGRTYDISGSGYEAQGSVIFEGQTVDPLNHQDLLLAARTAFFCANAEAVYIEKEKVWKVSGDPTEAALGVFGKKIGFKELDNETKKIFELPFDYTTKYHLVVHKFNGKDFLTVVGAPENVMRLSEHVWLKGKSEKMSLEEKEKLESVFLKMSQDGYRVLAFSFNPSASFRIDGERSRTINHDSGPVSEKEMPPLTFGGFLGMRDPLRENVKEAVRKAEDAGIRVVMITGDHKITASAIAKEAGILKPGNGVITGEELDKLPESELVGRFASCAVFTRVTPEQKLKIIEIFKKRGEVVAMTGDGVNDAPSLAAADLGVAMGKIGTEVAKEAADMVLLDDNFVNITSAVEEGRSIYKTIRKVILYLFSTSIGEVLTIVGSMILGMRLPILPAQIIWLNFVTDGFLDVSLAMEPKEEGLLGKNFAKPSRYILDRLSVKRMVFMGTIIAAGTLWVFSKYAYTEPEKAFTVALTALAVFQWFNAWNCKSEDKSIFSKNPFNNMFLAGATVLIIFLQFLAVYNPFMQKYLHTAALNFSDWILIIAVSSTILWLEELRKVSGLFAEKRTSS